MNLEPYVLQIKIVTIPLLILMFIIHLVETLLLGGQDTSLAIFMSAAPAMVGVLLMSYGLILSSRMSPLGAEALYHAIFGSVCFIVLRPTMLIVGVAMIIMAVGMLAARAVTRKTALPETDLTRLIPLMVLMITVYALERPFTGWEPSSLLLDGILPAVGSILICWGVMINARRYGWYGAEGPFHEIIAVLSFFLLRPYAIFVGMGAVGAALAYRAMELRRVKPA